MAANPIQGSNMVNTLTNLLKQVHFFGYGNSDLDPSLNPPTITLPSLEHGFSSPKPSSDSLASEDSLCSSESNPFQAIPYSEFGYSIDPDYNNTLPLSASFSSYSLDKEEIFSDKSDDEEVERDLGLSSERRKRQQRDRKPATPELPEYSLSEVAQHDMLHDCWIILYDKVYDITQFLFEHPGGEELLMEHAGRDGTIAFRGVGHSKAALLSLKEYIVGVLPESERIFSTWETH